MEDEKKGCLQRDHAEENDEHKENLRHQELCTFIEGHHTYLEVGESRMRNKGLEYSRKPYDIGSKSDIRKLGF